MKKVNSVIREKLEFLANLPDTDHPIITLYMNVNAQEFLNQAEKNRIFLKNSIIEYAEKFKKTNPEKLYGFKKDISKIKNYIAEEINTTTHGIAIFACDELNLFETFQSVIPFENEFVVSFSPYLKQLAFLGDEYENVLAIMLDSNSTVIYDVRLGGIVTQRFTSESDVHGFHEQGGWSQKRFQRGIQQEKEWHYRDTANFVRKLVDEEGFNNIVIIGKDYEVKNFEKHLPNYINKKVINTNDLGMYANPNKILETIINDLYDAEKEREFLTVRDIINRSQMNDKASMGLSDIIELASSGRIETLAVVKNDVRTGYKTGECLYITKDQHYPGCPECNGNCKETDLIEEVIRLTIKNGGEVEILTPETPAANELLEHDGIGAILRY